MKKVGLRIGLSKNHSKSSIGSKTTNGHFGLLKMLLTIRRNVKIQANNDIEIYETFLHVEHRASSGQAAMYCQISVKTCFVVSLSCGSADPKIWFKELPKGANNTTLLQQGHVSLWIESLGFPAREVNLDSRSKSHEINNVKYEKQHES